MKISILTACHDNEVHLPQCIDSMLQQELRDFQWIIVDDCSNDRSWKILSNLQDKRIIVIRNAERLFCSSTYQVALDRANGDVCAILDADDVLPSNALREIVDLYKRRIDLKYIYTQHLWCDAKLQKKRKGLSSLPRKGKSFVEMALQDKKHCFSHWRTFRREVVDRVHIFPEGLKYAVDKHMGFALEEAGKGGFWSKCLYFYRYHKKNMSLTVPQKQKKLWMKMARQYKAKRDRDKIKVFPVVEVK